MVLLDRVLGLVALLALAAVGSAFAMGAGIRVQGMQYIWIALVIMAAGLIVAFRNPEKVSSALRRVAHGRAEKLQARLHNIVVAVERFAGQPRALWFAFAGAIGVQFLIVLFYVCAAHSLAVPLSLMAASLIVPVSLAVQMVPVSINGFGVREAVFAFFFTSLGLNVSSALTLSLGSAALIMLFSLSGGAVFLFRPRRTEPLEPTRYPRAVIRSGRRALARDELEDFGAAVRCRLHTCFLRQRAKPGPPIIRYHLRVNPAPREPCAIEGIHHEQNRNLHHQTCRRFCAVRHSGRMRNDEEQQPAEPDLRQIAGVNLTVPGPVSPTNGAEITNAEPVRLVFNNASSNGQRPFWYIVELAADSNFQTKLFANAKVTPGQGQQTSVVVDGTLTAERTYYWRVKRMTAPTPATSRRPRSLPSSYRFRLARLSRSARLVARRPRPAG